MNCAGLSNLCQSTTTTMKQYFLILAVLFTYFSCSNNQQSSNTNKNEEEESYEPETAVTSDDKSSGADDSKGIGKFTDVELGTTLDKQMAAAGKSVYELKCYSCHKLTDQRVVGPGWKGVTQRRAPEWIMNFSTNTDEMLNKDPNAQAMLETCLIRMPNQNLSDDDARKVLEFMRENDGVK